MLNKVLVAKFLTAMTIAGLATGAAAGISSDDPADDGETIELETPFDDDDDDDADDTDDSDADDEAVEEEAEEDADESDGAVSDEPKAETHGSIVSNCARNTTETGRAKGEAVSTVAKDDTAECVGLEAQADGEDEADAEEAEEADHADDADVEDADEDEPRAAKAQGADHRNGKATEKLAERDARKAGR